MLKYNLKIINIWEAVPLAQDFGEKLLLFNTYIKATFMGRAGERPLGLLFPFAKRKKRFGSLKILWINHTL